MKKLTYVQKKLLKKVDLFNYKNESTARENTVMGTFNLKNHEEYRQYNKVVGRITSLVAELRRMPADNPIRIQVTKELIDKLYRMGVLRDRESLERLENISVTAFCRRRLSAVLKRLKFAQHSQHALQLIEHGHIKIGPDLVTDPAILVTRDMEDTITWAEGSKFKRAIQEFKDERDDFELLNC